MFGRPRYDEHELRAAGLDYMEIARRGGGIHSSVRDLRARSEDELFDLANARLRRLMAHGTTTIEVKSGYGLTLDDELKTLRVIDRLRRELPARIVPTFLGAHEIPLEHRGSAADRAAVCGDPHSGNDTRRVARAAGAVRRRLLRDRRVHGGREPRDPLRGAPRAGSW